MSTEATNQLKQSFFADRILDTIHEEGKLDKSKRELFERILEYLENVKNGESELENGSLVENPFESIKAYRNAFQIMTLIPCDEEKNKIFLKKLLKNIKNEVKTTISTKTINSQNMKTTKEYFTEAYNLAMSESSYQLMDSLETDNWKNHSLS